MADYLIVGYAMQALNASTYIQMERYINASLHMDITIQLEAYMALADFQNHQLYANTAHAIVNQKSTKRKFLKNEYKFQVNFAKKHLAA